MSKDIVRQTLVIVTTLATIVVNGLANALPINGMQTGEISDSFPVLFTPAGYVFAIWGVIYLGLVGYSVYQALPARRDDPSLRRIGYVYVLSGVANITWILLWHYLLFPLTLLAMLTLLGSLIVIYLRLDIGRRAVSAAERWLAHVPFSVYLGWVTVATIANVSVVLVDAGWSGWGLSAEVWTVIMLGVASALMVVVNVLRADVGYSLVLVWAFYGIFVARPQGSLVATAALVAAALAGLMAVVSAIPRGPLPLGKAAR